MVTYYPDVMNNKRRNSNPKCHGFNQTRSKWKIICTVSLTENSCFAKNLGRNYVICRCVMKKCFTFCPSFILNTEVFTNRHTAGVCLGSFPLLDNRSKLKLTSLKGKSRENEHLALKWWKTRPSNEILYVKKICCSLTET